MKSLSSFIVEYKGHAAHNSEKSIGDPDEIRHYFAQGWVHLKFSKDNAYPYVYNKKLNKIIIGDANTIHNNIFSTKYKDQLKEMGLEDVKAIGQIRYCCGMDDDTDEIDRWYEENKKYVDDTICGRIWYDAQDDFETWDLDQQEHMATIFDELKELDSCKCYIANWNEIEPNEFQKINDSIIKLFAKEHNAKIKSYIAIDNNGEPLELTVGDNVKVDKRSAEHEKNIEKVYNIHVPKPGESMEEFRKRKKEALKGYNKARGEHFQRDYYNQTKSKTAAEWHNNKTKRYNPRTGKMEWGEKIGDSLQMKNIKDYITEGFSSPDVFYIKNGPSVNWKMDNAFPFFYNKENGIVTLSAKGETTHADLLKQLADEGKTNFVKTFGIDPDCMLSKADMIDGVYDSKATLRGRVWMLPTRVLLKYVKNDNDDDLDEARSTDDIKINKDLKGMHTLFIAWWNEASDNEYKEGCKAIIEQIKKDINKFIEVSEYYFIDSEGDWELVDYAKNADLSTGNLKTDEEKLIRKGLQAIHLASQKEKAEYYRPWKDAINKAKDKEMQKLGWRDKDRCYAKRNHTFAKHIVKDETTGKYKVVYGAKIGDSLEMKTLTNYINEQLITEHFVNCKNEEEMRKYGDVVWSILKKAYEYCGGIKNVEGPEDLIKDTHLWKLYRKDGDIKAVICYTDRKGGRKMCLLGQDGSDDGRKMLKKMMEDDFKLKDRESWVGVSGKAAITALKHGGLPVPSEIAVQFMGSKCKPHDEYWYNRPIKGADGKIENHMKIMVGNPPGFEHKDAIIPQELLDKLIKQAIEFGE